MSSQLEAVSTESPRQPRGRGVWWGEIIGAFVLAVLIVITLGAVVVYVISGTDWGHERRRRYAQSFLGGAAKGGHAYLGTGTGNVLTRVTRSDFVIPDTVNQPFAAQAPLRDEHAPTDFGLE